MSRGASYFPNISTSISKLWFIVCLHCQLSPALLISIFTYLCRPQQMWKELQTKVDQLFKTRYKEGQIFSRRGTNYSPPPFHPWKQVLYPPHFSACIIIIQTIASIFLDSFYHVLHGYRMCLTGGLQLHPIFQGGLIMRLRTSGILI